jgi:hypothetical protein
MKIKPCNAKQSIVHKIVQDNEMCCEIFTGDQNMIVEILYASFLSTPKIALGNPYAHVTHHTKP